MPKKVKVKRGCVINPQYYKSILNMENCYAPKTLRIDITTWLHDYCALEELWFTSSDTHRVVKMQKEIDLNRNELTIWTIWKSVISCNTYNLNKI